MYGDLADWYTLISPPAEFEDEADHLVRLVEALAEGPADTLLEIGAGGGCMASHLSGRFRCTLTDLFEEMLAVSRGLNPRAEHVQGDMRTMRLDRAFDVVLLHDAVTYMTTEDDLAAAIATVAAHLRPGGLAVIVPDETAETYEPGIDAGGGDGDDGRGARYLEWSHPLPAGATACDVDWAFLLRDADGTARVVHDRHTAGVFPRATWLALLDRAGLRVVEADVPDPHAGERVVFTARRR